MKKFAFLLLLSILGNHSWGYTIFTIDGSQYKKNVPTELFFAGEGRELGLQFLFSAITKARAHKTVFRDRQFLIVWAKEFNEKKDLEILNKRGFKVVQSNNSSLTKKTFYKILKSIKKIHSVHIFSHNSAWNGTMLQKKQPRLKWEDQNWMNVKRNFVKGGYIYLHGCNSGFIMANRLSKKLSIPVFGSLSSTDFQKVFSDGHWYHNNEGQYPKIGNWLTNHDIIFGTRVSCYKGYCHRMKANNHPYSGTWGKYKTGLPYHKIFCNFKLNRKGKKKCQQAMRETIMTWPGETGLYAQNSYELRENLIDFLCPRNPGYGTQKRCQELFNYGSTSKSIFWGKTLNCTLKGCDYKTFEVMTRNGYKVRAFDSKNNGNNVFLQEYEIYREALNL